MNDKPLIGLIGFAGAGKDSVADVLCAHLGFARVAFADPLRQMALAINPILEDDGEWVEGPLRYRDALEAIGYTRTKEEYPEARRFLQRLGTEAGRHVLGDSIWCDTAMRKAHEALVQEDVKGVVFTDCRFPNEAEAIRAAGGCLWRVERPGVTATNGHVSERFAAEAEVEHTVHNGGTLADLTERVLHITRSLPVLRALPPEA